LIHEQAEQTFSSITSALRLHVNIGQRVTINTSSVFVSMETTSIESLSAKIIEQVDGGQIRMPLNFTLMAQMNTPVSVRVNPFSFSCSVNASEQRYFPSVNHAAARFIEQRSYHDEY
jgi:hypothetical protein